MKIIIPAVFLLAAAYVAHAQQSPYTYICSQSKCLRTLKSATNMTGSSINICKLNCDDYGSLWPKPTGEVKIGKELVSLSPTGSITLESAASNPTPVPEMLQTSFEIFETYISKMIPANSSSKAAGAILQNQMRIRITVTSNSTELGLSVDESYTLAISTTTAGGDSNVVATINAPTFFGARHALETLSQLIAYDENNSVLQVVSDVSVTDKPVFPYRGIMLDTSRNYLSVDIIKKIIDGMSYNKLSILHWHITDSHSFPMEVKKHQKMLVYGAYSPDKVYLADTIKEVVAYARQRGIKVVAELDQPAHSGFGYQWGKEDNLGDLVVCLDSEPWYDYCVEPPCGQLNLVNDNVVSVVGDILSDMMDMFDNDIFHMGGDEVDFRCYNSTKEVTDWMTANGYPLTVDGFYRLWGEFQKKVLQKLLSASKKDTQVIMWTSGLTSPERIEDHLDKARYIIQIWSESTDPAIGGVLQKGYRTIFANVDALYLDCGFQAWLGTGHNWCSPIKGWQVVYDNNPEKIYANFTNDTVAGDAVRNGQILGSVTPLWAEQVDEHALESRIWPRGAAHAERLWTHPTTSYYDAEVRMVTNRDRMSARGIRADRLQPEFCLQHEGKCYPEGRGPTPAVTTTEATDPTSGTSENSCFRLLPLSGVPMFMAMLVFLKQKML